MILFISNSGESLPIVFRLRREGTDARIYIHNPRYRKNYDGIIPKVKAGELKKVVKKADIIVFDITRANERTKQDIVLLKMFGLKASTSSVFGPVGDKLRKDHRVIGAAAEEIELDRHKGLDLAGKMGFAVPEHHEFNSLSKGLKFLKGGKDLWVFKPENNQDLDLTYVEKFAGEIAAKMADEWNTRIGDKCEYILQKKIEGAEVSTEVWVGPKGPEHFNRTFEDKRLMTGNLGPAIGSQSNTVWIEDDLSSVGIPEMFKMAAYLKTNNYIGPCDANLIISKGVPYFLEWTPRFGYDAIYCLFELIKGKLTNFFEKDFKVNFHSGYAASQRLSIPPFPYADKKLLLEFAKDVTIQSELSKMPRFWGQDIYENIGHLACAGADGILGVVTGRGDSLGAAWGQVYGALDKMKICSYLQFRPDGFKSAEKRTALFNKQSRRLKIA